MLQNVGSIVNFTMWPYGNAKESVYNSTYWHFSCQHGTSECIGNMYEACAIEHYPGVTSAGIPNWWPFALCLEKSGAAGNSATAQNCANKNGIDWSVITKCSTTTQPQYGSAADGNPLMHQIAVNTANLNPPHTYTPWIEVDGVLWTSGTLTQAVCKAYTGSNPPSACATYFKEQNMYKKAPAEGMAFRETEGMAYRETRPEPCYQQAEKVLKKTDFN